jgi:predicted permease
VSVEREVAEELAAHLALQTRRYLDAGMKEQDAERAARERFGDVEQVRAECYDIRTDIEADMRRADLRDEMARDVQFAVRTLRRSPLFAGIAIATLALGIGASTSIFSVVNAVLMRALPYRFGDRADMIWNGQRESSEHTAVAVAEFFDLRAQLRSYDAVAAITRQPSPLAGEGGEPEQVMAYVVTPNVFDLLGTAPAIGRGFGGDDGTLGAPRVMLLSHSLWTRRFGGDPAVVGRTVTVAGFPRTIVGVMPADVRFPDAPLGFLREPADLWIPTTWESSRGDSRGNQILAVVARRRAGTTDAAARADVDAVAARWRAAYPARYAAEWSKNWRIDAVPIRDEMVGGVRAPLLVISIAVGLVLLIACVNVANLLLARGAARGRELAIRVAMGAGRGRLVRQLLTETVLLGAAGGALGTGLAWAGVRLLVRLDGGRLPRLDHTTVNSRVLMFALALSVLTGLLVGLVPALQQSSADLRGGLSEGSTGAGDGRGRHRLRVSLVVAQVAMALVVLVGAGLLARTFMALGRVKPGFAPEHVLSMQLTLPRARYDSAEKVVRFYQQLVRSASALPGVVDASGGFPLPMSSDGWSGSFNVDGEPSGPGQPLPHAEYGVALPGYFRTMGIPMFAGRDFTSEDRYDAPQVAIVDEALAKQHWGSSQSAVGKRVSQAGPTGPWATVVGVVGHVHKAGPRSEGEPQLYLPHTQSRQSVLSIVVRTNGAPELLAPAMRGLVRSLDPSLPLSKVEPLDALTSRSLAGERFDALMLGVFGIAALLLASVGLYGVMAFLVSQRTREIGIRLALGGEPRAIRRMILREGLLISAAGLAIGSIASLIAAKAVSRLLYGVASNDVTTYASITALLLIVGVAASYGPAGRATRVDPLSALRS